MVKETLSRTKPLATHGTIGHISQGNTTPSPPITHPRVLEIAGRRGPSRSSSPITHLTHRRFRAELYLPTRAEGGQHTPVFSGNGLHFRFGSADVSGQIWLLEGVEMCMPGDHAQIEVELAHPVPIEERLKFAIRGGKQTIAHGTVVETLD